MISPAIPKEFSHVQIHNCCLRAIPLRAIALGRRRQWHPTPVLLPGKSHGWRSLEGCSPWGRWGSDMTEWLHFHFSLSCIGEGNGNPTHSSILAWRIPGTGEPGGLLSMGSHIPHLPHSVSKLLHILLVVVLHTREDLCVYRYTHTARESQC